MDDLDININENKLKEYYAKCASQKWDNNIMALNESDFAKLLILLIQELLPEKKDSFLILREFTFEFLYPNLLLNIHKLFLNVKPINRIQLSKL